MLLSNHFDSTSLFLIQWYLGNRRKELLSKISNNGIHLKNFKGSLSFLLESNKNSKQKILNSIKGEIDSQEQK